MFEFWLGFGIVLVLAEAILPGLVSIFVGMGALTVAALMYYHYLDSVASQFLAWFISSIVYIFSLRMLAMKYYPTDTVVQKTDDDIAVIGRLVEVIETIPSGGTGRIAHGDSTWNAISRDSQSIQSGEEVRVIGRDNITWLVERPS